jgi:hypothetical protein
LPKIIEEKDFVAARKQGRKITDENGKPLVPFQISEADIEKRMKKETLQAVQELTATLKEVLARPDMAAALGAEITQGLKAIQDREIRVVLQAPKVKKKWRHKAIKVYDGFEITSEEM